MTTGNGNKPPSPTAKSKRRKRHHGKTEIQRVAQVKVLGDAGEAKSKIARAVGVARRTVAAILRGEKPWDVILNQPEFLRLCAEIRQRLAIASAKAADASLEQAMRTLPKASFRDSAIGFGIFSEKHMLHSGGPTQIHAHAHIHAITRQEVESLDFLAERLGRSLLTNPPPPQEIDVTPEKEA